MRRVGLSWPTVEVVFKDLEIGARIKVGTRGESSSGPLPNHAVKRAG